MDGINLMYGKAFGEIVVTFVDQGIVDEYIHDEVVARCRGELIKKIIPIGENDVIEFYWCPENRIVGIKTSDIGSTARIYSSWYPGSRVVRNEFFAVGGFVIDYSRAGPGITIHRIVDIIYDIIEDIGYGHYSVDIDKAVDEIINIMLG